MIILVRVAPVRGHARRSSAEVRPMQISRWGRIVLAAKQAFARPMRCPPWPSDCVRLARNASIRRGGAAEGDAGSGSHNRGADAGVFNRVGSPALGEPAW